VDIGGTIHLLPKNCFFILTVYERRNGQWQQIAWQSTRDVGAPAE
jgi:hypothetical protein